MDVFALIAGLVGLWFGTEMTIRGAISIASRLGISEFIVGVGILSIGSDLPELAIAVDAAIKNLHGGDASDVVVGSALGSSMGQIGLVLGITGLLSQLTLPKGVVSRHGSILVGSLVLLGIFGYDGSISRVEGVLLVAVYAIYFISLFFDSGETLEGEEIAPFLSLTKSWLYLALGLIVVVTSAELTVSAVGKVALALNIEASFIAIIIIGLGTSLPELSISLAAVLKNRHHMSVGNIVGSNVFDTLIPVGIAATISGLHFDEGMLTRELPFLFVLTVLVLLIFARRRGIRMPEAIFILGLYASYVLVKINAL